MAILVVSVFWRRCPFGRELNRAFVGAAARTVEIASNADTAFARSQVAAMGQRRIFAQPMAQFVEDGSGGLISDLELSFNELLCAPCFSRPNEIGSR